MSKLYINIEEVSSNAINGTKEPVKLFLHIADESGKTVQNLKTKEFLIDSISIPPGFSKDFKVSVRRVQKSFIKGIYQINIKPSQDKWYPGEYKFALKLESDSNFGFSFFKFEIPKAP